MINETLRIILQFIKTTMCFLWHKCSKIRIDCREKYIKIKLIKISFKQF